MSNWSTTSAVSAVLFILAGLCAATGSAYGQGHATVIGPSNIDLAVGAELLRDGEAEEGIRRSRIGLSQAANSRERTAGNNNICAGYLMLDKPEDALPFCDAALEIQERHWRALNNRALAFIKLGRFEEADRDLSLAEDIAPGSRSIKATRAMLLDLTDPVATQVIIDDRRQSPDDDE